MTSRPYHDLSRRERQIMDALASLGEGSVSDVCERMADAPSYNSVRVTLSILERKGHVRHRREGRRYVYSKAARPGRERRRALDHVLSTFFGDSPGDLVQTLLSRGERQLSDEELEELARTIADERRKRSGK